MRKPQGQSVRLSRGCLLTTLLPPALPAAALQSTGSQPSNHEVAGFMPGRLEFDTEVENEAEVVIKDMEFGLVMQYGGADQPEPPEPPPAPAAPDKDKQNGGSAPASPSDEAAEEVEGQVKVKAETSDAVPMEVDTPAAEKPPPAKKEPESDDDEAKPAKIVLEIEDPDDVELKLTMLGIYYEKLNERTAAKDLIFDRGLLEYKKVGSEPLSVVNSR